MHDWLAQLEDQIRKFPRGAILIAFLAGALVQIFAGYGLLTRLLLKAGSPIAVSVAAWGLYRAVSIADFPPRKRALQ